MRDALEIGARPLSARRSRRELSPGKLALAMNAPSLLVMFLVLAYPIYYAGYLSVHKVGIGQMRKGEVPFYGLENYAGCSATRCSSCRSRTPSCSLRSRSAPRSCWRWRSRC
jgi:ABC-type sugar transport system permease subunit